MNEEPIFSILTEKNPCVYGGIKLDGSTLNGVVLNGTNCTAGLIGPYCRGGTVTENGVNWCCFGQCVNNEDCLNGNSCNQGTCCANNFCTYCSAGYYPPDSDNFIGGSTNNPANCPPGTAAIGPYNCNGTFGNSTDCWSCQKYYGPFYNISSQDFYGGSELYLQLCPEAGPDYALPMPFYTIRCAPENICCDLNTESCVANFGCVSLN